MNKFITFCHSLSSSLAESLKIQKLLLILLAINILILPTYRIQIQVLGTNISLLFLYTSLYLFIFSICLYKAHAHRTQDFSDQQSNPPHKLWWISIIWSAAAIISILTNSLSTRSIGLLLTIFIQPILLTFFINTLPKEKVIKTILYTTALLLAANGIIALLQYYTLWSLPSAWWGNSIEPKRSIGFFTHPNALALFVAPLLTMWLPFLKNMWTEAINSHEYKWILALTLTWILGLISLILSLSRTSWAAFILIGSLYILTQFTKKQILLSIMATALICALTLYASPIIKYRVLSFTQTSPSISARPILWQGGLKLIKHKPFLGWGLGGFERQYDTLQINPTLGNHPSPHNLFLHSWIETGFIGLLCLLCIFTISIPKLFYKKETNIIACGLFIGTIFLQGFFDAPLLFPYLGIMFFLVLLTFGTTRKIGYNT